MADLQTLKNREEISRRIADGDITAIQGLMYYPYYAEAIKKAIANGSPDMLRTICKIYALPENLLKKATEALKTAQPTQPGKEDNVLFERHEFSRLFSTAPADEIDASLRSLSPGEAFKVLSFMNAGGDMFLFQHPEKTALVVPVLLEAIGLDIAHAEKNNLKVALRRALNGINSMEARQQTLVRDSKERTIPCSEIKRLIAKAENAISRIESFQTEAFPNKKTVAQLPKIAGKTAKI